MAPCWGVFKQDVPRLEVKFSLDLDQSLGNNQPSSDVPENLLDR